MYSVRLVCKQCNKIYYRTPKSSINSKFCSQKCKESYSPEKKFLEKIKLSTNNNCWEWQGAKDTKGYGQIRISKKLLQAHRFAYRMYYGEFPSNLQVCHNCDNPGCVNPEHLFLGTQKDNMIDKESKNRGNHKDRKNHPHTKLTKSEVIEIFKLKGKESQAVTSKKYNVSRTQVFYIQNKKSRKQIVSNL